MKTWLIRKSRFPLELPGAVLGTVVARDRHEAERAGQQLHGTAVTAEPWHQPERELTRRPTKPHRVTERDFRPRRGS